MRPGSDGELGVGQRHDAAVALGHAVHAEERLVGHAIDSGCAGDGGRLAAALADATGSSRSAP